MSVPDVKPFTVIGGFLGAGKTTLVNHILSTSSGVRYAVLVNDFGALNVDQNLIQAHDGQTLALANGCICCSLADGFINTLLRLMQQPQRFDHIIVEASGVSEPARIMDIAKLDPQLRPDAIIVLADAETLAARLADTKISQIVTAQLRAADLLLINKTDAVNADQLAMVKRTLRGITINAPLLECVNAELPLPLLLGPRANSVPSSNTTAAADGLFVTATYRSAEPLERARFDAFAAKLPERVLRAKGVITFTDAPERPQLWQRVGNKNTLSAYSGEPPTENQLLLIATASGQPDAGPLENLFETL